MKLVKIRFTSWRHKSVAPRTSPTQDRLDALTARERALTAAAATIKAEQAQADSEVLQKSLARIAADLRKIDAQRTFLLSAEEADAEAETRAATQHERVGTFGYQVFNKAGTYVALIVDEAGEYLAPQAVYAYEVVDENPPRPAWAKDGKFGH